MTSTLATQSFEGAPDGMNLALAPQEILPTEARYIQDAFVDKPGLVRRRGPVQPRPSMAQPSLAKISGLFSTLDPQSTVRYGAFLSGTNVGIWSSDLVTLNLFSWYHDFPTSPPGSPYRYVSARPWLTGGTVIADSSTFGAETGAVQAAALWRGSGKSYSTGTLSVTQAGTAVTGVGTLWLANAEPGMFLFANTDANPAISSLIGEVKSVNSDTSITLGTPALLTVTAKAYTLLQRRGLYARCTAGRITCSTASAVIQGGNTKFIDLGLNSGIWDIYRANDLVWIGKVASVQSNTQLTLAANAAIGLADENYMAFKTGTATLAADLAPSILDGQTNPGKLGWLTTTYANRQWYANSGRTQAQTYRLWFSDTLDPESVDWSTDGDWLSIGEHSTTKDGIRGLASTTGALLVFKDQETYAVYGNDPSNFSVSLLHADGALSPMTIQEVDGGAVWTGRQGIYLFDGVRVTNLAASKLGNSWKAAMKNFDTAKYRAWSMLTRGHYLVFIEAVAPDVAPVKGNTTSAVSKWTVSINLATGAFTLLTNVNIRGATATPSAGGASAWYAVNDSTTGYVCSADDLFDAEGVDTITCAGDTAGPDFYFESRKFNAGDPLRLKRFKMLLLHYLAAGGAIKADAVTGLNDIGQTLVSTFPSSSQTWDSLRTGFTNWTNLKTQYASWNSILASIFLPKRVKFQKQTQHFAFRIYQSSSAITSLKIGPYQIGFKYQRPGRV